MPVAPDSLQEGGHGSSESHVQPQQAHDMAHSRLSSVEE